jgi:hypothetical protein
MPESVETIVLDETNVFKPAWMRIVAISDNTNGFGLRGVVLVDRDTLRGWEVGANAQWLEGKQVGETELIPCHIDTGQPLWHEVGVEIPNYIGTMPEKLAKDLGIAD